MAGYIESIRKKVGHERLMMVGAGVIVHKEGQVLLQKRRDNGFWADHGGCVEIGERLEDAARRELREETGLTAHSLEFFKLYSGPERLYTYPNGDEVYIVSAFWLCEDFSGILTPQPEEVSELRWFPVDALPDDIFPLIREPLRDAVAYLKQRDSEKHQ